MIKKIKNIVAAAAIALLSFATLAPVAVYAAEPNIENGLCQGADLQVQPDQTCDTEGAAQDGTDAVNGIITLVINIFSVVVGVVSVIMIIIGGFKYITSGGDSGNVTGAKNTIMYAIIGLVVVALAQLIVKFVLGKASQI